MGKIFYLMGKSSSGKDTIFKRLLENKELSLYTIVPYTTRPIRAGETEGTEYFFVGEEELQRIEAEGKLIELRAYHTFHGVWKYFTVDDKQVDLINHDYLVIGTVESYHRTKEYFGAASVEPILIDLEDGIRLQRAIDREKSQDKPKYQELCRRFLADAEDFSEEKLERAGIHKCFHNDALEHCLEEITCYIKEKSRPER